MEGVTMKLSQLGLVLALTLGVFSVGQTVFAQAPAAEKGKIRIGTFDSRAVAVAYIRSEAFLQSLNKMTNEQKKASQEQAHLQGFGTASVANILDTVKDQLPAVAKEAGVDILVSKWDLTYQSPSVEVVDVTAQIVKPFKPNEKTQKVIEDLLKHPPVPNEQIKNMKGI
jgi:hypothetical protein